MSAQFSALYEHSSGLVQWSPNGRYVAMAAGRRLIIRDSNGFEIIKGGLRPCLHTIEGLEWASDSDLILCALYKRSFVEVFSVSKPSWQCRIREGMAGMVKAQWTPDARHMITFSDYNLHMTVWSLTTQQMHTVRQPKAPPGCLAFSPDLKVMAVATRRDCRDHVRLYEAATWEPKGEFPTETLDSCSLEFSPDGAVVCVLDTTLEYRVLFYSQMGQLLARLEPYSNALGARSLSWSPDGNLLAVGSYDQCARLISPVNWKAVAVLRHVHPKNQPGCDTVACYREVPLGQENETDPKDVVIAFGEASLNGRAPFSATGFAPDAEDEVSASKRDRNIARKWAAGGRGRRRAGAAGGTTGTLKRKTSSKHVDITYAPSLAGPIPTERPDPTKPNPRLGVGQILSWSYDGRYLATRNDCMASTLWVWDTEDLGLYSVVVQMDAVKSAKWCPTRNTLAICTGNHHVYLWNPEGASWVDVPAEGIEILGFRWAPLGDALLLLSKDRACCCYLTENGLDLEEDEHDNPSPGISADM